MSECNFSPNIELADFFVNLYKNELTDCQVAKVLELMQKGVTIWIEHNLANGSKRLMIKRQNNEFFVIIETIGIGRMIVKPSGECIEERFDSGVIKQ